MIVMCSQFLRNHCWLSVGGWRRFHLTVLLLYPGFDFQMEVLPTGATQTGPLSNNPTNKYDAATFFLYFLSIFENLLARFVSLMIPFWAPSSPVSCLVLAHPSLSPATVGRLPLKTKGGGVSRWTKYLHWPISADGLLLSPCK